MAACIADHVWSIDELIALMPERPRAAWGSKSRGLADQPPAAGRFKLDAVPFS
jgi:hypothetical protein